MYRKRWLGILTLLAMICLTVVCLGSVLGSITYADCLKWDIREIQQRGEDVDLVFLGNSRVNRTFIPGVFEEKIGLQNVLNGGSPSQSMYGTYYQLKDFLEKFHPRQVVIGVTWNGLDEGQDIIRELIVYDRISWRNKILMMIKAMPGEERLLTVRAYRYRENLFHLPETIQARRAFFEGDKPILENVSANVYYDEKGFVFGTYSHQTGTIGIDYSLREGERRIDSGKLEMIRKSIALCREQGIDVCLVTGPTSMSVLYTIQDYQDSVDYYRDFASEQGVDYYNLNYLRGREEFLPDEKMCDMGHVNGEGAKVVSEIFADILRDRAEGKDTSHYFYADFEEMKADVHRIVALAEDTGKDPENPNHLSVSFSCLHNEDVIPEYQIELIMPDDTEKVLVPWTTEENCEIDVGDAEDGVLKFRARADKPGYLEAFQMKSLSEIE